MPTNDLNLPHLRRVAEALGDLREQLVFLRGAVAGLLITDPLAESVRATRDVDAVVNADWIAFHRIENQVAQRGFAPDAGSDVICRWVHKATGLILDLMPVRPEVLGFSNSWYPYTVQTAEVVDLGGGLSIRRVSAAAFVATKLEAFASRGGGDFLTSHDFEDVLNIIDGRNELAAEVAAAPAALRAAVAVAFSRLLANPDFANVLPGLIAEPERAGLLMHRLRSLASSL